MSLSEALSQGLMVTGVGVIIVFSVLIILMLTMMAMKKIFYKENKPKAASAPVAKAETKQPETPVVQVSEPAEDPNLIAVIAAAVAASLNTSASNLKIRSFRRIGNTAPDWNKAGLRDTIDSRF